MKEYKQLSALILVIMKYFGIFRYIFLKVNIKRKFKIN